MESLVTMPDIARLARVTRQAVTNWRTRPASTPFPDPVTAADGLDWFDSAQILDWLDATGRGRNLEARLDAPALAVPATLDLEQAVVLLTLRANGTQDIGPLSTTERIMLAEEIDPEDRFLLSEARVAAADDDVAAYVDELLAAAYGPADALARLYDTRPARGDRGFAPDLIMALQSIAGSCRTFLGPDGVAVELQVEPRARQIAAGFQTALVSDSANRSMLRHLTLDGLTIDPGDGPSVRITSVLDRDNKRVLAAADEVALDLEDGQVAVIVGPAAALCDRLTGDLYDDRRQTLQMQTCSLVAAFRLPRGLWREAHRKTVGLWVLRGGAAAKGVVVADLSGRPVDPAGLADDVLGALEQSRARAYRYGRVLPYNEVWTRDTVVMPGIGTVAASAASSPYDRVVEATLVTSEPIDGFDLPLKKPKARVSIAPRSLGELVDSRTIKLYSGTRIHTDHLDPAGSLAVLSADPNTVHGHIDPFTAADHYSHAVRTEPGDVVFSASSTPRALVDQAGGSLVATPSRILRIDPSRTGIGPHALAAAINAMATSSEWKTWPIPAIPAAATSVLEDSLTAALDHLDELRRHEDATTSVITNLIQGVADGSVALEAPTTPRKAG